MKNLNLMTNDVTHKISQVDDESDRFISRLHVTFLNGYCLSIVRGWGTYGGKDGLFEIAVFLGEEIVTAGLIRNGEAVGEAVVGWQAEEDVRQWAIYVANLPEPVNG